MTRRPLTVAACFCVVAPLVVGSGAACSGSKSAPAPKAGEGAGGAGSGASTTAPSTSDTSATTAATGAAPTTGPSTSGAGAVPSPGKKLLTIAEARAYMLALINRDRATEHLAPVELEEGPAQTAGTVHAEDMAKNGYLGHWGTDGSVPEQRSTDAGGADYDTENALCFTDKKQRKLDPHPMIDADKIASSEALFFNEKPPNDGHRKNILRPQHTKVGIGVAQPFGTQTEIAVPCFSQEFVDAYGTYAPIPKKAKLGSTLHVSGTVNAPATFSGVGLARVEMPKPLSVAELNTRRTYPTPQPYQMYWPPGFKTPIPVVVNGNHFTIDVPLSDGGRPGLYELSVWGKVPSSPDFVMLSLRTLRVE